VKKQAVAPPKLNRESYFATHLYFSDLPDGERVSAELATHIRALREADPKGIVKSNVQALGAWHSMDNLEKDPNFTEIARYIVSAAKEVFNNLGYQENSIPVISNMWANVSPKFAFNRVHTHPGSAWSGVYYVYGPENSGKIYFQDPRPQAQVYNIRYHTKESRKREVWSEVFYDPKVGRLILFPAWLQHEVQPNLSELEGEAGQRISISFNIYQGIQKN
jgi:uncharacterized protein (TIGR02466 family)